MNNYLGIVLNEQKLLRLLLYFPEYITKIDPKYFISENAKNIYLAIDDLISNNINITVDNLIIKVNKYDSLLTKDNLETLFDNNSEINEFNFLYENLKKEKAKFSIREDSLKEIIKEVSSKDDLNLNNISKLQDDISKNLEILEDTDNKIFNGEQLYEYYKDVLEKRSLGNYFKNSGDPYLDSKLAIGFAPGTISTIFGATGNGKTMFATSLLLKQINRKIPVIYVSLEMPREMLLDRIFCMVNQLPSNFIYPKNSETEGISEIVFEKLEEMKNSFFKSKLFKIIDSPSMSINELRNIIKKIKKEWNVDYINVIVDLTTMLSDFSRGKKGYNKADNIEECMNRLNSIVKETNCHILNLVQSNREQDKIKIFNVDDIQKLKPTLGNIKSSNAIAERSRLVMSVFRPKYYADRYLKEDPEAEFVEDILYLDILKQSQGYSSELKYLFDGDLFLLTELRDANSNFETEKENFEEKIEEIEEHSFEELEKIKEETLLTINQDYRKPKYRVVKKE